MRNSILTAFVVFGFSLASFAQIPNYIPTDSLIAWWPFNGNAQDESVNNNNGIVSGATLTWDRHNTANSAYYFDGIDDFIEVLHHSSLNFGISPYTISIWVRGFRAHGYPQFILSKERNLSPDKEQFRMAIDYSNNPSNNHFYFATGAIDSNGTRWTSAGGYVLQSDSVAIPNVWTLLSVVRKGIYYRLYVNGVLQSKDSSYLGRVQDLSTNLNNIVLGAQSWVSGSGKLFFYEGAIDDIGIWKRALSPKEVLQLYTEDPCESFITKQPHDTGVMELNSASFITKALSANATFQWQYLDSTGFIDLMDNANIQGSQNDTLTLWMGVWEHKFRCIVQNGMCNDTTDTATLYVFPVGGISELSDRSIKLYPNPSTKSVWITCTPLLVGNSFSILDLNGRTLIEGKLFSTQEQVDISHLNPGLYFFHLQGQSASSLKLLKI